MRIESATAPRLFPDQQLSVMRSLRSMNCARYQVRLDEESE
jgi:hypothetical protein